MLSDFNEASAGKQRQAGVSESFLVVLGESAGIEGVLEMLKGESEVEDSDIC